MKDKIEKLIKNLEDKMSSLRSSRPSQLLVQNLKISDGRSIKHISSFINSHKELILQIWEKENISKIEQAIQKANLNINVITVNNEIKLSYPPLSEEDRVFICKNINSIGEEQRIALRQIRKNAIDKIKQEKYSKELLKKEISLIDNEIKKYDDQILFLVDKKKKEIIKI